MNRGNWYIIAGIFVALVLTITSLGYSHRVLYFPLGPSDVTAVVDYSNWGYPMPWYVSCNTACPGIITGANMLHFAADFVLWLVVGLMAMFAVSYARGARPTFRPPARQ